MNIEELHEYCASFPETAETFPFDDVSLVMKVCGKMFALIPLDEPELQIALKCDPEKAIELREKYSCVEGAYHFNKKYWNTIYLNRGMKDEDVKFWIRHSIDEVVKKLPKQVREAYYQNNKEE
ncbi:MmcQ/YjbR family DNA-binding protein [Bacteroidales bacterium OttesenSCG-928-A17]|nr:MmcQ/YjbR family DNA-binding protein [Bacteroidales bacterium OttesenSCG-928-A17]